MQRKVKAIHALNWYYGNICARKCPEEIQRQHYDRMLEIIRGHEEFMITHRMFVQVIHEKYDVCGLTDEKLRQTNRNYWNLECKPHLWHRLPRNN